MSETQQAGKFDPLVRWISARRTRIAGVIEGIGIFLLSMIGALMLLETGFTSALEVVGWRAQGTNGGAMLVIALTVMFCAASLSRAPTLTLSATLTSLAMLTGIIAAGSGFGAVRDELFAGMQNAAGLSLLFALFFAALAGRVIAMRMKHAVLALVVLIVSVGLAVVTPFAAYMKLVKGAMGHSVGMSDNVLGLQTWHLLVAYFSPITLYIVVSWYTRQASVQLGRAE